MDISQHTRIVVTLDSRNHRDYHTIKSWDTQGDEDAPRYVIHNVEVRGGSVWVSGYRIKKDGKPSQNRSHILVEAEQLPDEILRELGLMLIRQTGED